MGEEINLTPTSVKLLSDLCRRKTVYTIDKKTEHTDELVKKGLAEYIGMSIRPTAEGHKYQNTLKEKRIKHLGIREIEEVLDIVII